jgi:hypothetical protein
VRQRKQIAQTTGRTDFSLGVQDVPHSAAAAAPHAARGMGEFVVRKAAPDSTATAGPTGAIREMKVK